MSGGLLSGRTLDEALRHLARARPGASAAFPGAGSVTAAELDGRASRFGAVLRYRGVRPGELVGLAEPAGPNLLVALFGVVRAGAVASVLPGAATAAAGAGAATPTATATAATTAERIVDLASTTDMAHVIIGDGLEEMAREIAFSRPELMTYLTRAVAAQPAPCSIAIRHPEPDDPAITRFTSGSDIAPAAVERLTHRDVMSKLRARVAAGQVTAAADVVMEWEPHDDAAGLIRLISHLLNGVNVQMYGRPAFARRPGG